MSRLLPFEDSIPFGTLKKKKKQSLNPEPYFKIKALASMVTSNKRMGEGLGFNVTRKCNWDSWNMIVIRFLVFFSL
jgi:hypothetical protein